MISLKAKLFFPPRSLTVAHYSVCSERSPRAWESPSTQGAGGCLRRPVSFLGWSSPQEIPWRAQDTTEMEKEGWGREWPKGTARKQGVREMPHSRCYYDLWWRSKWNHSTPPLKGKRREGKGRRPIKYSKSVHFNPTSFKQLKVTI